MNRMRSVSIFLIFFALLIVGCKKEGDGFIGCWKAQNMMYATLEIVDTNNGFVVIRNFPSYLSGRIESYKFPARLYDDTLSFVIGLEEIDLSIDETTGMLLYKRVKFEKISKNEYRELLKIALEENKALDEEDAKP